MESCRKKTKPRTLDLHDIFCGVLYVLKSGCQWRMVSKEFPKWRNCYDYFKKWSEKPDVNKESVLELVLKKNNCDKTMVGKASA
ncbi:transposase [Wolbachia endosymbiont (group A) of Paraperithous gnathaulax]|uniref:transposase n=1 Tax=Wolbachia endosymbiont (group A) of Paraperithous gnathaulax TaxID=3066212 RepID=UPI001F11D58C